MNGLIVVAADVGSVERGNFGWARHETGKPGATRADTHEGDAHPAIEAFVAALPEPQSAVKPRGAELVSLIGAALVRAGWTTDLAALGAPCLVVRA